MSERSALGSRVKVDSKDVVALRKELELAATAAKNLHASLKSMGTAGIKNATAAVSSGTTYSHQATFGGQPAGGGMRAANQHGGAINSTLPQVNMMQGVMGGSGKAYEPPVNRSYLTRIREHPVAAGLAATAGYGITVGLDKAGDHLENAVQRSYVSSLFTMQSGTGANQTASSQLQRAFKGSSFSYSDTNAASATVQSSFGGGARGISAAGAASALGSADPSKGAAGGATRLAGAITPSNYLAARLLGVRMPTAPDAKNMHQYFNDIISAIERRRGRKFTSAEVQTGMQQGTALYATLNALGGDDVRIPLINYWTSRAKIGDKGTIESTVAQGNPGLIRDKQSAGASSDYAGTQVDKGAMGGYSAQYKLKGAAYNLAGDAAGSGAGQVLTKIAGFLGPSGGGVLHQIEYILAGMALTGGMGGGGKGGIAGSALRGGGKMLAGSMAARGALMTAGAVGAVAVVAAADAYLINNDVRLYSEVKKARKEAASSWKREGHEGTILKVSRAAAKHGIHPSSDATYKSLREDAHNAAEGDGDWNLALKNLRDYLHGQGVGKDEIGGSGQAAPLAGGVTYPQIEAMADTGPGHRVTSTTQGHHANGSYHYKGEAVDFGAARRGDAAGMLAINKHFASKYGGQLAELIYGGPGGINIKDGKVVNGLSFYGRATMDQHKNHVHVAMTPAGAKKGAGMASGGATAAGATPATTNASSGGRSGGGPGFYAGMTGGEILSQFFAAGADAGSSGTSAGGGGGTSAGVSTAAGSGSEATPNAPSNVTGNKALAKKLAAAYGWGSGAQWNALYALWQQEGGFRTTAGSISEHSAYGIPQAYPGHKMGSGPHGHPDWRTNPSSQIDWGLDYIHSRYGSPAGAQSHKHATDSRLGSHAQFAQPGGWYGGGKWELLSDEVARVHKGEMIVPAQESRQIRDAMKEAGKPKTGSSRQGGVVSVNANLTFNVMNGSEQEMRAAAKKLHGYIDDELDMHHSASH